jgi:hypothetical protein
MVTKVVVLRNEMCLLFVYKKSDLLNIIRTKSSEKDFGVKSYNFYAENEKRKLIHNVSLKGVRIFAA